MLGKRKLELSMSKLLRAAFLAGLRTVYPVHKTERIVIPKQVSIAFARGGSHNETGERRVHMN